MVCTQVDGSVWATLLALIWLYGCKIEQQVEWQFVAMKAASWIGSQKGEFPIDTPLVLRLVKTHMGKCLFSPELKSYLITQWNCTTIGSCRCRKRTNGSAAELHEPMATIRANIPAETGGASGYISGRFAIGSSDFFSFSDDDFVYADPEKPTRRWHASQ